MNILELKNRVLFLIIGLLTYCVGTGARQHIEVSAFYYHLYDMSRIQQSVSQDYTANPIQVRIIHTFDTPISMAELTFPKIGNGIAAMMPSLIYANMRVKEGNLWKSTSPSDFGSQDNKNVMISKIAYSYAPGNDGSWGASALCGENHYSPSLYTQSDKGNWYAISTTREDSVDVDFNIDPSLFYVLTSIHSEKDDMDKVHMTILPKQKPADFYLFYRPAFKLLQNHEGNHVNVNFLFENINDSLCVLNDSTFDIQYYQNDSVAKVRLTYLMERIKCIQKITNNKLPFNINFVLNSQNVMAFIGDDKKNDTWEFSMVKNDTLTNSTYIFVNHSMFYTQTLLHEMLHSVFPEHEADSFSDYFFRESITEYVASYLFNKSNNCGEDIFIKHKNEVDKYYKSDKQIRQNLKANVEVVIGAEKEKSTYWIYYDYLSMRLHNYGVKSGNEEKFCKDLVDYLMSCSSQKPTFKALANYMKLRGYRGVESIWNI